MNQFRYIQRGRINLDGGPWLMDTQGEKGGTRFGVVSIDKMSSPEFANPAVTKAYARIMNDAGRYSFFETGISAGSDKVLVLCCKKEHYEDIVQAIKQFIDSPYELAESSGLEKIGSVEDIGKPNSTCPTNFWWCLDNCKLGNWIAFLDLKKKTKFNSGITRKVLLAIRHDYATWWIGELTGNERQKLLDE